jgi:hypothetical protein
MYGTASGSADMQRTANQVERLGARLNDPQRRRAVLRLFNVKAFGFERVAEELTHRRFVLVSTYTVARELGHEPETMARRSMRTRHDSAPVGGLGVSGRGGPWPALPRSFRILDTWPSTEPNTTAAEPGGCLA